MVWLGLTILVHIPLSRIQHLRVHDQYAFIPNWSFFAPVPGTSDYHLMVRDKLVDGTVTVWREADLNLQARGSLGFVWNPAKRTNKALCDIVPILLQVVVSANGQHQTVYFSLPYLMLLNAVSSFPRSPFAVRRQFMLVKTDGPDASPDVLFVSAEHAL